MIRYFIIINYNNSILEKMSLSFKIVMLGNSSTGKTSILNRFINDNFDENY